MPRRTLITIATDTKGEAYKGLQDSLCKLREPFVLAELLGDLSEGLIKEILLRIEER